MYRQEILRFQINSNIVFLHVLSCFPIPNKLSYFTPVSKPVPSFKIFILLEPLKEQQLLFGSPLTVKDWEIEPVNHMVFVGGVIEVGETAHTVI
jgi:hypothetical protein